MNYMQSQLKLSTVAEVEGAFDQDFTDEDKTCVKSIFSEICGVIRCDPVDERFICNRQRGPEIIRKIMTEYERWKRTAEEHRKIVTLNLAKLSLCYWIKDSILVAELLREVVERGVTLFRMIHVFGLDPLDSSSLLAHSSDYSMQVEHLASVFFLHHAHKERMCSNGIRYLDLNLPHPVHMRQIFAMSVLSVKPNLLLNFLRFGARVDQLPTRPSSDMDLKEALCVLIELLWDNLPNLHRPDSDQSIVMGEGVQELADCIRYLLRVSPQIRIGDLNFALDIENESALPVAYVASHDFIRQLSQMNIIPKLVNRYLEPSELSHLCRCVIRNRLNETWNLPYGVALLPLPQRMKDYLSILYD